MNALKYCMFGIAPFAVASPAFAAGFEQVEERPIVAEPVAMVADHWTGAWVGAGLGMGSTNYNISGDFTSQYPMNLYYPGALAVAPGASTGEFDLPDFGGQGPLGSAEIGYSMRLRGNLVLAAQLDYTATGIENETSASVSQPNYYGPSYGSTEMEHEVELSSMITGAVRVGYLPSPSTQIYGLIGATRGDFEGSWGLSGGYALAAQQMSQEDPSEDYDFELDGVSIGGGIETMVTDNVSMKVEYRYTRFEDYSLVDEEDEYSSFKADLETEVQSVRAVASYHF